MKTQFDDDVVGARASPVDATPTQSFESSPTDSWAQRDTTFQASTCVSQSEERVDLARRAHEKGNMGGGGRRNPRVQLGWAVLQLLVM